MTLAVVTAILLGLGTAGIRLRGLAFNEHRAGAPELWDFPNQRIARAQGQASTGGVAPARGLAGMYAAAATRAERDEPSCGPERWLFLVVMSKPGRQLRRLG